MMIKDLYIAMNVLYPKETHQHTILDAKPIVIMIERRESGNMMTREQIERIATNCGVIVSYQKEGNGGFIIDNTNIKYESLADVVMDCSLFR